MKFLIHFLLVFVSGFVFAQDNKCKLGNDGHNLQIITYLDLPCIASASPHYTTVFYTYSSGCPNGLADIDKVLKFEEKFKTSLYIVMVESQINRNLKNGIELLRGKDPNVKILILNDHVYGKSTRKRNAQFISEISSLSKQFNPGYGHFIVMNKRGEFLKKPLITPDTLLNEKQDWMTRDQFINGAIESFLDRK